MPPPDTIEAPAPRPCDLTIAEAAAALRDGSLSAVALTESVLARIEETEPVLNAYQLVTADLAREQAARADEELAGGRDRGPLHGIPFALKDLFDTAGIVTTAGSGFLRERVPDEDAFVVARLYEAGIVLTGKLGMHEFAFGTTSDNAHFGTIRNPWNPDYTPGGSSGGSGAAAAAGSALGTLGSDTGGSIRIPAAVCGVSGLKPTRGLVSRNGVFPLSHTLDHAGPLTKSVEDSALILNAIAGYDPADPQSVERPPEDFTRELGRDLAGLRLGVPRNPMWANCADEVVAVCEAALDELRALGAEPVEVELPSFAASRRLVISPVEGAAFHEPWLRDHPERYSDEVRGKDRGRSRSVGDRVRPRPADARGDRARAARGARDGRPAGLADAAAHRADGRRGRSRVDPREQHAGVQHLRPAGDQRALRPRRQRPAGGADDRRASLRRGYGLPRRARLRAGDGLAAPPAAVAPGALRPGAARPRGSRAPRRPCPRPPGRQGGSRRSGPRPGRRRRS